MSQQVQHLAIIFIAYSAYWIGGRAKKIFKPLSTEYSVLPQPGGKRLFGDVACGDGEALACTDWHGPTPRLHQILENGA